MIQAMLDSLVLYYSAGGSVRRMAEPVFGHPETHSGFWNIPPMRIYVWPTKT